MKIINQYLGTLKSEEINLILESKKSININQIEVPFENLEINKKLINNNNFITILKMIL